MSWNNGFERKKFDEKQKKLEKEYRRLGMNDIQIQKLYDYDLCEYRGNRSYRSHTQSLENISDCIEDNERNTILALPSYSQDFTQEIDCSDQFWWIEQLEKSYEAVSKLSYEDKKLLTLIAFLGYSEAQVAREVYKVSKSAISIRMHRIRNTLLLDEKIKEVVHNEN